jgi:hypothetical protein
MKCISLFSAESENYPERKHRKSSSISSIGSRISIIFKGPPERQSKSQQSVEQPTEYRHKPTHSGSSFLKTTTTTAMVYADPALQFEGALRDDPRFDDNATLHH